MWGGIEDGGRLREGLEGRRPRRGNLIRKTWVGARSYLLNYHVCTFEVWDGFGSGAGYGIPVYVRVLSLRLRVCAQCAVSDSLLLASESSIRVDHPPEHATCRLQHVSHNQAYLDEDLGSLSRMDGWNHWYVTVSVFLFFLLFLLSESFLPWRLSYTYIVFLHALFFMRDKHENRLLYR